MSKGAVGFLNAHVTNDFGANTDNIANGQTTSWIGPANAKLNYARIFPIRKDFRQIYCKVKHTDAAYSQVVS